MIYCKDYEITDLFENYVKLRAFANAAGLFAHSYILGVRPVEVVEDVWENRGF
jgi:hypothetical protein